MRELVISLAVGCRRVFSLICKCLLIVREGSSSTNLNEEDGGARSSYGATGETATRTEETGRF